MSQFDTQQAAQVVADKIHQFLIGNIPAYAESVKAGLTTAWDVPSQNAAKKWDVCTDPLRDGWTYSVQTGSFAKAQP